jgi:hypothetical protein
MLSLTMTRFQRLELLLFVACFFGFAYFDQGGGWNQNSRFAEVRAIVEEGRFAIDDFLVYKHDPAQPNGDLFIRVPLDHAEYTFAGERYRLSWVDQEWNLYPVTDTPAGPDLKKAALIEQCSSGDIGYVPASGQFHPNKPPGTTFLGVPAYWVIYHVERWAGLNPDDWWILTLNAWLTSVCSVGLVSALACVLFFRLARDFSGGDCLPAALATLAFAFGTTFFPFGTIFFDHNLTAGFLLAAFYCLWRARQRVGEVSPRWGLFFLSGVCAGIAAITNYIAAPAGAAIGVYALLATRRSDQGRRWNWPGAALFTLGVLPLLLLICWYNTVNFGSPFKLANDFQNPLFKDTTAFLGMFNWPSPYVAGLLTISPYRGIFFLAPVLVMGCYGLVVWLREKTYTAEARLCLAMFGFFFLVNVSFNGYHGGFSAGPRYLVPGLPFLALPLVVAFTRHKALTGILAVISVFSQLLLTATDAQNPIAVGGHARNDHREDFFNSLVGDYAWPLFAYGRAWPMLDQLLEIQMTKESEELDESGVGSAEKTQRLDALRRDFREGIRRGDVSPFLLAAIEGPVSVNPIGVFEGLLTFAFFPPHSHECDWNSFNVGEFLFPKSRWSLLPLVLVTGGLGFLLVIGARREDERRRKDMTSRARQPDAGEEGNRD